MPTHAYRRKELEGLAPNFSAMKEAHDGEMVMGVIVTVPGNENSLYDAFSRFFAPLYGVNEDPVTGETHLFLAILCHTYRTKHSIEPDPVSTDTGCHYKKKNQLPAP